MESGYAAARAALQRFFPVVWVGAFFFFAITRSVMTPPFVALTVLTVLGTVYCAIYLRADWRQLQAEHATLLLGACAMALAVLWTQWPLMWRGVAPAGFIPAQAPLMLCLPVLALFLVNRAIFQMVVGLLLAISIWHFFMMPLEAATGFKWSWHPIELLHREVGPFKYQASGLALQSFTFVGLLLASFYLAWGPIWERRAFPHWRIPPRLLRMLPLLWLIPVASVQSRSALAGAFIASVLALLTSGKRPRLRTWLFLAGCAVATIAFYIYMFEGKTGAGLRLAYMKLYVLESLQWRWLATGQGFPVGQGPQPTVPGLMPLTHSHNDLVQVFFSWGLPGLLAYLAFWVGLLRLIWTRFIARGEYWPALALLAVLPSMITDLGFHFFEKAAFLVVLAGMCMACTAPARSRAGSAQVTVPRTAQTPVPGTAR